MKSATVYERKEKLYIHSSSETTAGVWIMNAPVLCLSKSDIGALGSSIRRCLSASRGGIPHPETFTNIFKPVLDLAGVKSYASFVKSVKCLHIRALDEETVTLVPTRNDGAKGGFAQLPNTIQVALGSDTDLGSAAVAALAVSQ